MMTETSGETAAPIGSKVPRQSVTPVIFRGGPLDGQTHVLRPMNEGHCWWLALGHEINLGYYSPTHPSEDGDRQASWHPAEGVVPTRNVLIDDGGPDVPGRASSARPGVLWLAKQSRYARCVCGSWSFFQTDAVVTCAKGDCCRSFVLLDEDVER